MRAVIKRVLGVYPPLLAWGRSLVAVHRARRLGAERYLWFAPPGHYYSPLPDAPTADRSVLDPSTVGGVAGIDLGETDQLELARRILSSENRAEQDRAIVEGGRFRPVNDFFSGLDARILGGLLRHVRPRRVIEVGSGFSSALMLDVAAALGGDRPDFTFIEPDPARLRLLLKPNDWKKARVVEGLVQTVDLAEFRRLERDDVLFVDSSHVAKVGSDVLYLLFEVLPCLQPGVWIHFHDIHWPFEYPGAWHAEGRAWNESYFVRAFLMNNPSYRIRLFNSWLISRHWDQVQGVLGGDRSAMAGSLWIQKVSH